ncbi:MAG: Helix-turn-helix domain [Verrucomicrobiota bacterium]|jgi:transcriptional regulator with XRE-family HTH domain
MKRSPTRTEIQAKAHRDSFEAAVNGCRRFARRFQQVRERAGMSIYALEMASGVSRVMIDRIERGDSHPTMFLLFRLAFAMKVSVWEFSDDPPPKAARRRRKARGARR